MLLNLRGLAVRRGFTTVAVARPANPWERRAPLAPEGVRALVAQGVAVRVAPSSVRAFSDAEYEVAGASVSEDLGSPDLVLTVSPPEAGSLLPGTTYATFSHSRKAPSKCAPLLAEAAAKHVRLIDYELLREGGAARGDRLVSFSRSGGHVGMINTFGGLGSHLLSQGFTTPFLAEPQAWMQESLWDARRAVFNMGEKILQNGIPAPVGPLVFVFMGDGEVGIERCAETPPHAAPSRAFAQLLLARCSCPSFSLH